MRLSSRLREVSASATLAVKAEAEKLRARGQPILDLSVGEPDFDTPDHVKQAAHRAIDENFTHYTVTAGIPELRRSIAARYADGFGSEWTEEAVAVGCGAKNILFALAQALFSPGDDVAIFVPYWVSYPEQVRLAGARPLFVPTREEDGFTPRAAALAERLTPAIRAVFLNSPCNPTGATIPATELREILALARERDLVVISDEVYEGFVYDGENHASVASLQREHGDRLVLVSGLSKSHAMTGWRIGYALGPTEIIRAAVKVLSHDSSQSCSISQKAALAALDGPNEPLLRMRADFETRRNYVVPALREVPGLRCSVPRGAFYVFPNVQELYERLDVSSSTEVANWLIRRARCATVPGEAFGLEGYVRISYAASMETLQEAMLRIREAVRFPSRS
jgi:aspartate aminotransferase